MSQVRNPYADSAFEHVVLDTVTAENRRRSLSTGTYDTLLCLTVTWNVIVHGDATNKDVVGTGTPNDSPATVSAREAVLRWVNTHTGTSPPSDAIMRGSGSTMCMVMLGHGLSRHFLATKARFAKAARAHEASVTAQGHKWKREPLYVSCPEMANSWEAAIPTSQTAAVSMPRQPGWRTVFVTVL